MAPKWGYTARSIVLEDIKGFLVTHSPFSFNLYLLCICYKLYSRVYVLLNIYSIIVIR